MPNKHIQVVPPVVLQTFWEVLKCDHVLPLQVDTSLQNGFAPGMKLEVAVKSDQNTYWVATIITTCGQLLLLRYDGYGEDRKADFWCDILTADLHPIGWCEQNKKVLKVPEGIVCVRKRGVHTKASFYVLSAWQVVIIAGLHRWSCWGDRLRLSAMFF